MDAQAGYVLADDGDSNAMSEITGSGTAGQMAVFTAAQVIGNPSIAFTSSATGFTIGASATETSALLSLSSTTLGFLPPRMTTVQRDAIVTPLAGLLVFNSTLDTYSMYQAGIGGAPAGWNNLISTAQMPITYAVGDILYASTTSVLSRLADVAAGSYLRSGGVATAPVWSTLILPNVATANQIVHATSTNTYGGSSTFLFDGSQLLVGTATAVVSTDAANFFRNQNASSSVWVLNNTNNTAAQAGYFVSANNNSTSCSMRMLSASFTTSGPLIGGSCALVTNSAVGMQIGCITNVPILFWVNNTNIARFNTSAYFGVGGDPTSTIHTFGSLGLKPTVSSASTLSLDATATHYVFSGTTTTWTLPAVASTGGRTYFIKNRGSGAITLNSDSGSTLYTTAAVSSITINPGESYILISDSTYFNVM